MKEFRVTARSSEILAPVHMFPGDEAVDAATYRRTIFSGFLQSAVILVGGAHGSNVRLDAITFERWKRGGAASGLLDSFLDDTGRTAEAVALYDEAIIRGFDPGYVPEVPSWVDERLRPAVLLMRNSLEDLEEANKQKLIVAGREIGRIALMKANCMRYDEYESLLTREALATTTIALESPTPYVRQQPEYAHFATWCRSAIIFATMADSARDLPADYQEGRVAIAPTLRHRRWLGRQACRAAGGMMYPHHNLRATEHALWNRIVFSPLSNTRLMKRYAAP